MLRDNVCKRPLLAFCAPLLSASGLLGDTNVQRMALLERGIRVLVYVGANDWVCNWVSVRAVGMNDELTERCRVNNTAR